MTTHDARELTAFAPEESTLEESPSARAKALKRKLPVVPAANDLVPARMINEVLYCERLMYLEWVQGEWADNLFTVDGRSVHRRVDGETKPLKEAPESAEESEPERPYVARSVWLSSERLGITGKIDVVEVDGGRVLPIEYKRGSQPEVVAGAYALGRRSGARTRGGRRLASAPRG
jgi:CRISP-associated protein Cas1